MKNYLYLLLLSAFGFSCSEAEQNATDESADQSLSQLSDYLNISEEPFNYSNPDLPDYFTIGINADLDHTPAGNPVTDWGATLGRVLFYDTQLSANNTLSCASCHKQNEGFSDQITLSVGFEGGETGRNSMGLSNARYYESGHFFWDERAESLEEQVLLPIQDPVEMGLSLEELVARVSNQSYYPVLFTQAFGDDEITTDRISRALSQFVRSIVSYQSKYDEGRALVNRPNDDFPNFTELENLGKRLFFSPETQCSNCHVGDVFVGDRARNNGLDAMLTDFGVGGVSGNNNDNGEFKTGSMRNIEHTAPYMHDGRFATLEEVVEHYNSGVQNSPDLDNRLRVNGQPRQLNLTEQEKEALVLFMKTLTDIGLSSDPKYSNPFINN
ncbi:MAG: cytochrome c peroxidase [Bacteroidota bacterium]